MAEREDKLLLTVNEAASLTGVSPGTLYHWVSEGRVPVVRLSRRCIRFSKSDLEEWIRQLTIPPRSLDLEGGKK